MDPVVATYQWAFDPTVTGPAALEKLAANIAVGQTVGTYDVARYSPEERAALEAGAAQVLSIEEYPTQDPHLRLALIRIAFPLQALGADMAMWLTVLFGKVSMSGPLRLVDIEVPAQHPLPGPRYGIAGVRQRIGEAQGPLLMGIFKPCVGLKPETLAAMLYEMAEGGVQLVKDDEILVDADLDSARRRLEACLQTLERVHGETGRRLLYALHLNGPAETLLEHARLLSQEGANAFLFNYLAYGPSLLAALRNDAAVNVPLMAHPALAGAFYGSPYHGIAPKVLFGRIPRLAGADLVLFPSPYGSVALPKADALTVSTALTESQPAQLAAFPVPSAGIQAHMAPQLLQDFGPDVVVNAGTGIHDVPEGTRAGAKAFRQALNVAGAIR